MHRVGGKYPNAWHYQHMYDPQSISPGSIMPRYPWLLEDDFDIESISSKIGVMITLNVPYPKGYEEFAQSDAKTQAQEITDELKTAGITTQPEKKIVALIAYLQRLGTDIKGTPTAKK
ncbi:hypothetical protein MASR1M45_08870 [Candidatus Kapaibacterium sp.]